MSAGHRHRWPLRPVALVGLSLVLLASGVRAVDALPTGSSTWAASREWIRAHVPAGASVTIEPYSPWVDPGRYDVRPVKVFRDTGDVLDGTRYVVISTANHQRYLDDPERYGPIVRVYERLLALEQVAAFRSGRGPDVVVLREPGAPALVP